MQKCSQQASFNTTRPPSANIVISNMSVSSLSSIRPPLSSPMWPTSFPSMYLTRHFGFNISPSNQTPRKKSVRVYVKLWLLFTLTSSALAKSDSWLIQTLHTHIFCISKVTFIASLTTPGLPCCHHCNLRNQPTNTPYLALIWIYPPQMISAGNTKFSFNSSVLPHGHQIIKHITGVNFNPKEKCTSNPTNNTTLDFTIISRLISDPNCNISQSNQEIRSTPGPTYNSLHLSTFLMNSNTGTRYKLFLLPFTYLCIHSEFWTLHIVKILILFFPLPFATKCSL